MSTFTHSDLTIYLLLLYRTVVEQANQWLETTPQYLVTRCETVVKKLENPDYKLDNDVVFIHMSSHGSNTFLTGLR